MVFVLIGFIAGCFAAYKVYEDIADYSSDWVERIIGLLVSAFVLAAVSLAGVLVAGAIGGLFGTNVRDVSRTYLGNLQDGSQTQGSVTGNVFMTVGRIDEHQVYTYYKQVGDGEYRLSSLRADDPGYEVTVKQGPVERPYVETVGQRHEPSSTWWYVRLGEYTLEKATFYIPDGSIVNEYVLDAK